MTHLGGKQIGVIVVAVFGVVLISLALWNRSTYKIIYNPSPSAPRGWYVAKPTTQLHRGDLALVQLPPSIRQLADQRRYLPKTVPLLKSVGAVAGDQVCEREGLVQINGTPVGRARVRDGSGRVLVAWADCRQLIAGELFLLGTTSAASFDSRYYGPIDAECVIGIAIPLWTW
jgi:conjugative transfer signal peptidase TraF